MSNTDDYLDFPKFFGVQVSGEYFTNQVVAVHWVHPPEAFRTNRAEYAVMVFEGTWVGRGKLLGKDCALIS